MSSQTRMGSQKAKKHKIEYDVRWKEEFPWHVPVYSEVGNSESSVRDSVPFVSVMA